MQTVQKLGADLQEGDRIAFWCFGDTPATITKLFPIKSPFSFVTHAMRLEAETKDGKFKSCESSIENQQTYTVFV